MEPRLGAGRPIEPPLLPMEGRPVEGRPWLEPVLGLGLLRPMEDPLERLRVDPEERCGALREVDERWGALREVDERWGALREVDERWGALREVDERWGVLREVDER